MNLLFDQKISHRILPNIQDISPNAKQVRELGLENLTDKEIWDYAKKNEFIIVTFDTDFYDLSLVWGNPPKIVWIRTFNQTNKNIELILRKHINDLIEFQKEKDLSCLEIIYNEQTFK
jgi:predicted nuclease of predicted toxin-antitoxin system